MTANTFGVRQIKFDCSDLGYGITGIISPLGERIYVITGENRAMVIDTGTGIGSLKQCIRNFCALPLIVVDTHGHPDHAGGNAEFEEVYLHPDDNELYFRMATRAARAADLRKKMRDGNHEAYEERLLDISKNVLPLNEGQEFDLGGRKITAYKLEGHTAGSVVLYDDLSEYLFVGDAINREDTWLHLGDSVSLVRYRNALSTFISRGLKIKKLLSGHAPNEAPSELLNVKLELLNKVISGELIGEDCFTFAGNGKRIRYNNTGLIYDEKKIDDGLI